MERTFGQRGGCFQRGSNFSRGARSRVSKTFRRRSCISALSTVLGPIEDIISHKTRLSFVLNGALTSLPPQVLITTDPKARI